MDREEARGFEEGWRKVEMVLESRVGSGTPSRARSGDARDCLRRACRDEMKQSEIRRERVVIAWKSLCM
jgi:hypothetical protein